MIDSFQVFVVSCDECATPITDATGEQMEFTNKPLATKHLYEIGWKVEGEKTLCPTCAKELEEKVYAIVYPVIGYVHIRVNATSEDEALEKFKEQSDGLAIAHNLGEDEPLEINLNLVEDLSSEECMSFGIQRFSINEIVRQ